MGGEDIQYINEAGIASGMGILRKTGVAGNGRYPVIAHISRSFYVVGKYMI